MAKYRKKPIVIEAIRFMGGFSYDEMLTEWGDIFADSSKYQKVINALCIFTSEGNIWAGIGDYIIKGIKGEFYPCKPDIFEATYDFDIGYKINNEETKQCQ